MENFKSYYGVREIGPFHHKFSAIIGPNGSGKSNLIDSLVFVFGKRASWMRLKNLRELIHNSANYQNCFKASVTVYFEDILELDNKEIKIIEGSQISITRSITKKDESSYLLNGEKSTLKGIIKKLKEKGIDLDNNRFIILQGEIEEISLMKDKTGNPDNPGYLEYLEDIIGTAKYVNDIKDLEESYEDLKQIRMEKSEMFFNFEENMKNLNKNKDEALDFLKNEEQVFKLKNLLNQLAIFLIKQDSEKSNKALDEVNKQKQELNNKIKKKKEEQHTLFTERKKLKDKNDLLTKEEEELDEKMKSKSQGYNNNQKIIASFVDEETKFKEKVEVLEEKISSHTDTYGELKSNLPKLKKKLEDINKDLETILVKIDVKTPKFQKQINEITTKLNEIQKKYISGKEEMTNLREKGNENETVKDILTNNLSDLENKLKLLKNEFSTKKKILDSLPTIQTKLKKALTKNEEIFSQKKKNYDEIISKLEKNKKELNRKINLVDSIKTTTEIKNQRGRILNSLLLAQASGKIRGIIGRLGDLAKVENKYDIAISTAGGGGLNKIVVRNLRDGELAVKYLRKNKIGKASFYALDKIPDFGRAINQRFSPPYKCERIFDLLEIRDKNLLSLFYMIFRNTLIAPDLQIARKNAFESGTRKKIVTMDGDLIEISGVMSGGGAPTRGLIRTTDIKNNNFLEQGNVDEIQIDIKRLRSLIQNLETEIYSFRQTINELSEDKIKIQKQLNDMINEEETLKSDVNKIEKDINVKEIDFQTFDRELDELKQSNDYKHWQKDLENKQRVIRNLEKKKEKLENELDQVGDTELQNLRSQKKSLETQKKNLEEELINAEANITNFQSKLEKYLKSKKNFENEIENINQQIKEIQDKNILIEKDANDIQLNVEKVRASRAEIESTIDKRATEFNEFREFIKKIRNEGRLLDMEIEKINEVLEELKQKKKNFKGLWKNLLNDYNTTVGDYSFLKELDELKEMGIKEQEEEEINSQDDEEEEILEEEEVKNKMKTKKKIGKINWERCYRVKMNENYDDDTLTYFINYNSGIMKKIKYEEELNKKKKPNLEVLNEYKEEFLRFNKKKKELKKIKQSANSKREKLLELKDLRKKEFMIGFEIISRKLRETYRILAKGGDAELEIKEISNPFSEGIHFSVRPPQKSWKQMSKLSGGEKTLSSLALVYALHFYKPNSVYFMDEIDAALDYKNVSIVGDFIKNRTEDAQFIVVSLRNNMYEKADLLVGIYKTFDISKCIILNVGIMNEKIKKKKERREEEVLRLEEEGKENLSILEEDDKENLLADNRR